MLGLVSSFQCVDFFHHFSLTHCNAYTGYTHQTAKDVRASQDALIDVFERIEMFFRRLDTYTQVPLTTDMMDTVVQMMVEVLSILGIATKDIKQGRMSEYFE